MFDEIGQDKEGLLAQFDGNAGAAQLHPCMLRIEA
jgi:hypothetical protein